MNVLVALLLLVCGLFALEEFILIRAVCTIAQSDATSRRLENLAIWGPAVGIALTGATLRSFGGIRAGGIVNGAGLVLCLCGIGLRYWSRRTLGRFFTIGVVRQEGHRVIRTGPYRIVRHPAYLGLVTFYAGIPLLVGSWAGLLILSLPALAIFVALIRVEDDRLAAALGTEYRDYMRRSSRLLPGVW